MVDFTRYIGLPFAARGRNHTGVDCWGLVRLILAEQYGVKVPSWHTDYSDPHDSSSVGPLIRAQLPNWIEVSKGSERPGDVLLLRSGFDVGHVGMVIQPGLMIHIEEGINATVERYNSLLWRRRVAGFFRHRELVNAA